MATKTKTFGLFGVDYRTTQFTAVQALEIMERESTHPIDNLRLTQAHVPGRGWVDLDSRESINEIVRDETGILAPRLVLQALLRTVNEYSFGFTTAWKGVKIPKRFTSGVDAKSSSHVDPLIAQLLQEEVATLKELEEYYSLEDAFKMLDVMVAKGVNEALAHEASMKKR